MELSKQVVSLDLAKRLKELGVTQESWFWWRWQDLKRTESNEPKYRLSSIGDYDGDSSNEFGYAGPRFYEPKPEDISAFTVAELGEMLRPYLKKGFWFGEEHELNARDMIDEANSRAKMVIYLIENGLVKTRKEAEDNDGLPERRFL